MVINKIISAIQDGVLISKTIHFIGTKAKRLLTGLIKKTCRILPINRRKIIFDNFGGGGFADHPRYIAEEIHRRGLRWKMIWLVRDKDEQLPKWMHKVRFGSLRSYYEVATAHMWVDNIRNAHLMPKRKGQVYLHTWHGTSLFKYKLIEGEDEQHLHPEYISAAKYDGYISDGIISQCKKQSDIYSKYFWLNPKCEILEIGGPREDCLFSKDYVSRRSSVLRKKLGLSGDDYIILYAPTFRDDGNTSVYNLNFNILLSAFEKITGKNCKIAIRLHPNVIEADAGIEYNDKVINSKIIKDSTDAVIMCDALVSDFSGIVYEACILNKPVFCCALDLDSYHLLREIDADSYGFPFINSSSAEELSDKILSIDMEIYQKEILEYMKSNSVYDDGNASKRAVDWLIQKSHQR